MDQRQPDVTLRAVEDADIEVFYVNQLDPVATAMAAFPGRDGDAHHAHWNKILQDPLIATRTVLADGDVAGNIVSWPQDGRRLIGYWIGKPYWGKGVATLAVRRFVQDIAERPLHAFVAAHNVASRRVLEKCGFVHVDREIGTKETDVEELLMELSA